MFLPAFHTLLYEDAFDYFRSNLVGVRVVFTVDWTRIAGSYTFDFPFMQLSGKLWRIIDMIEL